MLLGTCSNKQGKPRVIADIPGTEAYTSVPKYLAGTLSCTLKLQDSLFPGVSFKVLKHNTR